MEVRKRICTKCLEEKPESDFFVNLLTGKLRFRCKPCGKLDSIEYQFGTMPRTRKGWKPK